MIEHRGATVRTDCVGDSVATHQKRSGAGGRRESCSGRAYVVHEVRRLDDRAQLELVSSHHAVHPFLVDAY
ncbi:hypothetical protein A3K89_07185 [Rhodococcoides kyotonense]|uniref:Uncharacterized protein n=1 Tax=Rhodococcoides kyotonense TaxID=398843 RepID=A0A177YBK1_9NOCA|nr:hypothetical protein A3K89_07185 [Rhodococcus kyotonensis]